MMAADRSVFEQMLANLCAGFNVPCSPERINGYWTGLAKMHIRGFTTVVEYALGPGGPERFPTVHVVWEIYKKIRGDQPESRTGNAADFVHDILHLHGQRVMLSFLRHQNHGASEESLQEMIKAKNKLLDHYRLIASEEPEAGAEIRDALWKKFTEIYKPMCIEEYIEKLTAWQRQRGLL